MFNRGSFNGARFNLPEHPTEVEVAGGMLASCAVCAELSSDFYIRDASKETIGAKATAAGKAYEEFPAEEHIAGETKLSADYIIKRTRTLVEFNKHRFNLPKPSSGIAITAAFTGELKTGKNCHIVEQITGRIGTALRIGGDLHIITKQTGTLGAAITAAAQYTAPKVAAYEIINCLVSTAVFDTLIVSVDVTIPPRGRLVIDSENFYALLNNENVLDRHEGAWLNMAREIEEIKIDGGGARALKASVLYTERYL